MYEALAGQQRAANRHVGTQNAAAQTLGYRLRHSAHRRRAEIGAVTQEQGPVTASAQALRLLQDRIEYWREVAGRGIHDLQDLGHRRFASQRFSQLLAQPPVFDLAITPTPALPHPGGGDARSLPPPPIQG